MRNSMAMAALCLSTAPALAHVSLAEPNAMPGSRYVAHFRVGHGCDGKPTTALTVALPRGVTNVAPEAPPGWSIAIVREGTRTTAITWKGSTLPGDKPGIFTAAMTLPGTDGQLAFPTTQMCGTAQEDWNEMPSTGATLKHPAPLLTLAAAPAAATGLVVSDAWFRALPGTLPAGGYFTLRNTGTKDAVLSGATSPACETLMLHKSETKGGMAAMGMVGTLPVPAGGSVSFTPGSYHLMCTNAKPALKPGASAKVTLLFQDGATLTADFAVRNAAGK